MISKDTLENLVRQGLSQHKIAKLIGVGQSTVKRYLKKYALQTYQTGRSSQKICIVCTVQFSAHRPMQVFCSNKCQRDNDYHKYIHQWLSGQESGQGSWNQISRHIRRWIFEQRGEACWQCGWNIKHPDSGKCPLEIDHIDGDHANNRPSNLRLLCPNCHALTSTYKNRNKGRGRHGRRERYRGGQSY